MLGIHGDPFVETSNGEMMRPSVLTGEHFMTGDVACAEGAIAAGCRFFGGYPITPATEIAEHISDRLPEVGGTFIQMELPLWRLLWGHHAPV